jgi:uncharacterized protein YhbP (UPF0306 family)
MIDIRKRVIEVLNQTHLMSLGTLDKNGVWVADLVFIFDDNLNIYWLSEPECRHSKAILENNKIAATITQSTKSKEPNFCIQLEGVAERLKGARFDLIIKHWTKRSHPIPNISDALKVLEGDCWYKLTPTNIQIIDEKNFGFDRQELKI